LGWITFDCYGTLVDWRAGIARGIEAVAPGQSGHLLPIYYRQEALRRAAAEGGVTLPPGSDRVLPDSLPDWPVFPDVGPALSRLRDDGWKLAILSNIDRDLFEGTRRHLPVPIDGVVTAEDVGSYKPAHGHFLRFREVFRPEVQVHVAQSWFHDIVPARALEIPAIWINRLGERNDPTIAAAVLPDLRDLPAAISRLHPEGQQDRRQHQESPSL
jgi:2-haloacid dehalogenase